MRSQFVPLDQLDPEIREEIIQANLEAFRERRMGDLLQEYDRLLGTLPWWVKVYLRVYDFVSKVGNLWKRKK